MAKGRSGSRATFIAGNFVGGGQTQREREEEDRVHGGDSHREHADAVMGDSDGLLGAMDMLKLCAREHKRTGAAFLTTARELWNAELLRNEPSITSITDRITKFKRDCDNMSFLQALANVKEFKQFGRTPLASVADMREWLPRHSMTDYAVLKQRLRELKNERGTAGKLSQNTISLYQHKIRDIQNRAVPAKERQAVVPKKSRRMKGTQGLHLVLKGIYYDWMVIGFKDKEYR